MIRDGRLDQNVIEGAGRDGFFVRIFVDAGRYPITLAYRAIKDAMNEMTFADRREVDGLRLPFRISTKDGKRTIDDLVFDQVSVNSHNGTTGSDSPVEGLCKQVAKRLEQVLGAIGSEKQDSGFRSQNLGGSAERNWRARV